jgi:hypothetical protein
MKQRWLEGFDKMTKSINESETVQHSYRDASILRDMATIYGSLLVAAFFLFCVVRIAFPRPYTVRRWTDNEDLKVCISWP